MRHADAELQLWLANDRLARERREAELARMARSAGASTTVRQRAGRAVIALGERLAGDRRGASPQHRVAARAS
jgi:hypothetical protein